MLCSGVPAGPPLLTVFDGAVAKEMSELLDPNSRSSMNLTNVKMDTVMTSEPDNSWIEAGDQLTGRPWTGSEVQRMLKAQKKQELVRQQCVEAYSSSPLYQRMAAKDPDYWKNFSTGCVNL